MDMPMVSARADDAGTAGTTRCGRPRRSRISPERESELYEAVLQELRESGYDALTMEAVAARTRSSKATLYRKWRGKPHLVAAALRHNRPFTFEGIDTGSFAGDLREVVARIGGSKKDVELFRAFAPAVTRDPELAAAVREILVQPDDDLLRAMVDRAVRRGEVAEDCPARAFLHHLLFGAVMARPVLDEREPDTAYLEQYVEAVVLPAFTGG